MATNGSNELNALLQAKVVKIRAELDVNGSLPKLKEQVDEISRKLENKPVKLKVNFDVNVKDFNTQIGKVYKKLNESSTAKTSMKLQVEIDVNGSASKIKSQLQEIYKTVGDFNKKYGQQMKQMQDMMNSPKGMGSNGGKIVAPILDDRALAESVDKSKAYMKDLFGNGLFSSQELKNAQGELMGFVGTLTKANGVIEKIKYEWDKDKGSFVPINAQTLTQTEQTVHKAQQLLTSLYTDIEKLKGGQGKVSLFNDFANLEKEKELSMDMVLVLKDKIKQEQTLQAQIKAENDLYRQQQQLIAQITREQAKVSSKRPDLVSNMGDLKSQLGTLNLSDQYSPAVLKDIKQQFQEMKMDYQGMVAGEKDLYNAEKKRLDVIAQITRIEGTYQLSHKADSAMSSEYLKETMELANEIKTMEDYIVVKQRMDATNREIKQVNIDTQIENQLKRLELAMKEFATQTGLSQDTIEERFQQVAGYASKNLALATSEVQRYERLVADFNANQALIQRRNSIVQNADNSKILGLIDSGKTEELKKYLSTLNQVDVTMMRISTDAKGLTRIQAQLASTGKTAQEMTYEIDQADQRLRLMSTRDVFNANRNLGAFEQLRIAMERVPVWTIAMTAWYGTIRFVKEMTDQILQLDDQLTQLKRVANSNLNIDILFQGAVDLSKQLGNNVMDVLGSVNELARTFGDFNERQLLAITKTATLMSNVSDLTAQQATQDLVGTMNAFNITAEDSIHIVDALNQVDNDYAVSTQQLAEGLSKSASTAKTFGVTMEETVGYITAIGSVTMESGNVIGNALKSIFSRISTVKSAYTSLQSVGVAVWDAQTGAVRPVDKVLADLAIRWNDLSDSQRQSIAVNVAGRYQLSRFLALMNNWQTATDATNTAINSQGSAMRENEKYLNSFGARINQLKSGFTELSSAVGDAILSAGIMAVVTALTKMAEAGVAVAQHIGVLPAVLIPLVLVLGKMGVLESIRISFSKLPEKITAVREAFTLLTGATRMFNTIYTSTLSSSDNVTRLQALKMAWRGVQISEEGATLATAEWGLKMKQALIETGIGALIVALGFAIEGIMNLWDKYKQKQDEVQKTNDKMVASYRTHADGMASLVDEYDKLSNKTNRSASEQQDYLNVTKQLASELPTTVAYVDANGQAHLKSTNEIKAEVENVKKLSQANAELTNAKFLDDLNKQADAYVKIQNNIDNLNAKQQELIANNGKSGNNSKAIAENKIEVMLAESDKTKAIQQTIKTINEQATAYIDAKGKLGELGDQQQSTMEKFVSQNESMLRFAKTGDQYKQAYQDLFSLSTKVGDVWTQAFDKMSKGMGNNQQALSDLKNSLGDVAKSVPNTFFQMTDAMGRPTKSIDQVTNGLKEIINVSNRVAQGDGNWNGLVNSLQEAGLSADQAKGMLNNLAREHDNAKLRAEAQAQGVDGLTASMDSLNQETLKAIDVTEQLFGYNKDDIEGMKSRIQAMKLLIDTEGEGAKSTQHYKDLQKDVTDFLGISASEFENNRNKIFDTIDALGKLDLSTYSMKDSFAGFVNQSKDLTQAQKNLLVEWSKTKGAKDIITGANVDIVQSNTQVQQSVQKVNDIFAIKPKNELKKTFEETKKSAPDKNWFQKMGDWFKGFGDWLGKFIPPTFASDLSKAVSAVGNFFKNVGTEIGHGYVNIAKGMDSALNNVPSKIGQAIAKWSVAFGTGLKKLGIDIVNFFKNLPKDISNAIKGIGNWWHDVVKTMDNLPDQTRPKLEAWYVSMKDWFAHAPKRLAHEMGTWYIAVWDFFHNLKTETPKKLDEWWNAMKDWFESIPSKIVKQLEAWNKASEDQSTKMRKAFVKQLDKWWTDFKTWLEGIPSKISKELEGWENAFSAWLRKQNAENKTQYGQWGKDIKAEFSKIGKNIYDGWDKWIRSIPPLTTWGSKIKGELSKFGTSISTWFKQHAKTVSDGVSGWFKSIPNMPLVKNIGNELNKMRTSVSKWFSTNGNLIYKNLDHMFRSIPPLDTWGSSIKKSMSKAWKSVGDWFTTEKDTIGKNLKKIFTMPDMSHWGTDIKKSMDGFGKSISKWFTDTKELWSKGLDGWWKNAREWFLGLGKKKEVHDAGKDMLDGVQKGVDDNKQSEIDKLGKTIVDILGKVLEALGIILLATGRELLKRLIKGIEDSINDWEKEWDKLKGKAVDKVVETGDNVQKEAKNLPSKMAKGIDDKIKDWEDQWDKIKQKAIDKIIETKNAVRDYARQIPSAIGDAISSAVGDLDNGIKTVVNKIAGGLEGGINWAIGGIDSVLTYMDVPSQKQIPKIKLPRYATGTESQGHVGGQALVGEEGRELAYIPNVGYTMLGEKGAEILDLPKGTSVLPNKQTEIMLTQYGFPAYASGTGWLKDAWGNISSGAKNIWGSVTGFTSQIGDAFAKYFQDPKKLLTDVLGLVPQPKIDGNGVLTSTAEAGITKVKDEAVNYLSSQMKDFMSVASSAGSNGAVTSWLTTAIKLTGVPMSWLAPLAQMVQHESGGNPTAVNNWDSNAKAGHPSKGLMQTIDSTFNAYAMKGLGNIYNPVANAVAGIRYILDRYGSIFNTPGMRSMAGGGGYKGYATGGIVNTPELAWHGEDGAEAIIPLTSKYRNRGLALWQVASEKLGIPKPVLDWLQKYLSKGSGLASGGSGVAGASSGDGGVSGGGADSGTSGTIVPSIPSIIGSVNMDGNYVMSATDMADPYNIDVNNRTSTVIGGNISELQAEMDGVNKSTAQYRDMLKQIIDLNNQNLALETKELAYYNQRLASISLRLTQLPAVNAQNEAQRAEYNALQQEYDDDLQKVAQLKGDIQTVTNDIHSKSVEIWTDFVSQITTQYDSAIAEIQKKVDNTDFQLNVLQAVSPTDQKDILNTQEQKASTLQQQQATAYNKMTELQKQHDNAVNWYGIDSEQEKNVKDALDQATKDYQQYTQDVISAETDIKTTRGAIADDGIQKLKDYYNNMKSMAQDAISKEKDELQKEHDVKMKMYDDEETAINNIYDAQSKAIDQQQSESQYASDLADKQKAVADLQNKINLLSRNGDISSKSKVADLQDQLASAQKDLASTQQQHAIDQQKQALDNQKQAQLDAIDQQKTNTDNLLQTQSDALDAESQAIGQKYDDLINNEQHWADVRNQAISGSFTELNKEITDMATNVSQMQAGIFDNLTNDFSNYADTVKQQVAQVNATTVGNMVYDQTATVDSVNQASSADNYAMTNGAVDASKGAKFDTQLVAPPPPPPPPPAPTPAPPQPAPSPRTHTVVKGDTLWDLAQEFYGNPYKWTTIYSANENPDPRKLQIGRQLVIPFDTGGYTGDWSGNGGKIAMLHKKELVLNQGQTQNILDTVKVLDKIKGIIPQIAKASVSDKIATASNIVNITYGDINITVENGDKKKASNIAKEILTGMKKMGK